MGIVRLTVDLIIDTTVVSYLFFNKFGINYSILINSMRQHFYTLLLMMSIICIDGSYAFSQWTTGSLSRSRLWPSATGAGNKAFVAGGYYYSSAYNIVEYNGVDIYDAVTAQWTSSTLSVGRTAHAAVAVDSLAFFAGGISDFNAFNPANSTVTDRVDIYNANTGQWTVARLSQARSALVGISVGGKVLFGGGTYNSSTSNVVDIYDIATNQWTVTHFPRISGSGIGVAGVGNKAYFVNNGRLEIYDVSTGQWISQVYPQQTTGVAAISVGNRVFFAGGRINFDYTGIVNIYDTVTGEWSTASLSIAPSAIATTKVGSTLFFGINNGVSTVLDIYEDSINRWSSTTFPRVSGPLHAASAGNQALFIGYNSNLVDIYTVVPKPVCQTIRSGNWADSAVWTCGRTPNDSDYVVINNGHTITIPNGVSKAGYVIYKGGVITYQLGGNLILGSN